MIESGQRHSLEHHAELLQSLLRHSSGVPGRERWRNMSTMQHQHCLKFATLGVAEFHGHVGVYLACICCSRLCCILIPSWSSWSHCWARPTVLCSVYLLSKISASSIAAPRSSIFFNWLRIARISWCLRYTHRHTHTYKHTSIKPVTCCPAYTSAQNSAYRKVAFGLLVQHVVICNSEWYLPWWLLAGTPGYQTLPPYMTWHQQKIILEKKQHSLVKLLHSLWHTLLGRLASSTFSIHQTFLNHN